MEGCERGNRRAQIAFAIAQIAAQRDRDARHVLTVLTLDLYSCQRSGSTAPTRATPPVRRPSTSSKPAAACSNSR